ncbi:MAG: NADH-quinone oxidoreductase subunit L [Gaiellaceae bacterium]
MIAAAWLCLLAPLAAVVVIVLAGTRISGRTAGWIATLSTATSFGAAVVAFVELLPEDGPHRYHLSTAWTWLGAGQVHFGLTILLDPLSVFMMLIVSGVGSLIVLYSIGYMHRENEERRYFAYMALFVFSMLLLVQAGNLLLLLVGWGLVGLSSYLLIGFYQDRPSAIAAAKKAFIVNTVGDATLALALFLLVLHTKTLGFPALVQVRHSSDLVVNLVALGLLGGAVAKSAQIPLHTWLPDAMEGPTPVSALIHAATMVTAGVYLIARTHHVFEFAPGVLDLAAVLGAVTLVVAGLIALVQVDIKRVIAYSTMSQIGYMFVGVGVGAYANGMFHLLTHAFFKALLFLAAGLVIHALAGEQDMRRMGGLRRLMPLTYLFFLAGALALVGVPPFAGFFSKDSILAATLARGTFGVFLWIAGIVGTFLTGLYTFRMLFLVFHGEPSAYAREHHDTHHGKEGPREMFWPVAILAVLAVFGGWIQFADVWTPVSDFLAPAAAPLVVASGVQEIVSSVFAVLFGVAGIGIAWWLYGARRAAVPHEPFAQRVLEHKFYFDELYDVVFYRPAAWLAMAWTRWIERPLILGSATELGVETQESGRLVARAQTGLLRAYALSLAGGIAILVVVFISVR